jgi:xanthine/uracil/vitamin C permease (AzgA family)
MCAQAIPAFLTLAVMPLTYSIAYGVVAGLVAYVIINGTNWLLDNVTTGAKSLPQWVAHVRHVSSHISSPIIFNHPVP